MNNCDIRVNTALFDTESFDIVMDGCTISCHGVVFTAGEGSNFSAKSCGFELLNGSSAVDITSAVTAKVMFKGCVFNTTLTDNQVVFLARNEKCVVVVDGCTVHNNTAKNFATDSRAGREYIVNSVFTGFAKVFYTETSSSKNINNLVINETV